MVISILHYLFKMDVVRDCEDYKLKTALREIAEIP